MRAIKLLEQIPWPDAELTDNFEFESITNAGTFKFSFKWLNNRWNVWVEFPDGKLKQAGTTPNVFSWTGSSDFGLVFKSSLQEIDYNSLFISDLLLITWQ